jgi:hypothetical protein
VASAQQKTRRRWIDALVNAGDVRFVGKALGPRNVGIMLGF